MIAGDPIELEEDPMAEWKQIGCAVDFAAPSWAALQRAVELAGPLGAQLTLLHVVLPGPGSTPSQAARTLATAEERLLAKLAEWRATAERALGRPVEVRLLAGSPASELARFASRGLDLLVVGTRGATGLGRVFIGSVAERVVRDTTCPVLVVHVREDEARAAPPA